MSRRKRGRTWRLNIAKPQLEATARALLDDADRSRIGEGQLCGSSGVWRKADGTLTARFAYRTGKGCSIIYTFRNLTLTCADD